MIRVNTTQETVEMLKRNLSYDKFAEGTGYVLLKQTFGDYQGDYAYLINRFGGGYSIVIQAYGSCSGCDHFEAIETYSDIEQCFNQFLSAKKFPKKEMISHLKTHDWTGTIAGGTTKEFKQFIKECIKIMKGE